MKAPTERFSNRVENYIKYRPDYPPAIIDLLRERCRLTPDRVIADIGSGTGILSELFLRHGNRLFGVEPNREMRLAGERLLAGYPNFVSVDGTAEATTLERGSVDLVTAGQAFHWFDPARAKAEFLRILRPGGWILLIWNDRRTDSTPFLVGYERLLQRYAPEYPLVNHKEVDSARLAAFFGTDGYEVARFDNDQPFDFEGLKGRLLSSSYTPEPEHPNYAPMMRELQELFERCQVDGQVRIEYDTCLYFKQFPATTP